MMMCSDCGEKFYEAVEERVCWESYYGVASQFADHHYGTLLTCPSCGSEDIDDYEEDYDE